MTHDRQRLVCPSCSQHLSRIAVLETDISTLRAALCGAPESAIAMNRLETIAADCEQAMVRSQQTMSSSRARLERGYAKQRLRTR